MTTPNIIQVQTINGNSNVANVTTSATAIVTNSVGSNKIFKINGIMVTNTSGSSNATLTLDFYRSSNAYLMASNVVITSGTTYTPVDKTLSLYLLEGDALRLTANVSSTLQAVATWEEIS